MSGEGEKLIRNDATPKEARKRDTMSLISVAYAMLMGNVEYAIVMPSLWLYLKSLDPNVPEYYFGIIMGGFNLASMLASPFFGYWVDKRPMKEIVIFCMFVGVIGNATYSLAPNVYVVLLGRLISGIGGNIYNIGMTYVIRTSTDEERSSMVGRVLLLYYCGMLFGPALNYPLSLLGRYQFGLFNVESLNAPGFLMVIMLLIAVIVLHIFFKEPMSFDELKSSDELLGGEEISRSCCDLGKYRPLFTSFTLMSVVFLQFTVQYAQIVLETLITPLTSMYYDFGQLENSLVYAVVTLIFFFWFGFIIFLSKYFQDRTLISFGVFCFGLSFVSGVAVYYSSGSPDEYVLPFYKFVLISVAMVSGIPFFLSSMSSLFSKLVRDVRIQGMGQSMLNISTSLANIIGPTVTGLLLPRVDQIFAMLLGVWVLICIILALRWSAFRVSSAAETKEVTIEEEDPAVTPAKDGGIQE